MGTRLSCFDSENKNGRHFTHFETKNYSWNYRRNNSKKHSKNSKKTTRMATSAIWTIFVELDKPKGTLSKMNLTLMQV